MYRGYWIGDERTRGLHPVDGVSRQLMALTKDTWNSLGGFRPEMESVADDMDLCAHALQLGLVVAVTGDAVGTSTRPLLDDSYGDLEGELTSQLYSPAHMPPYALHAYRLFSERWWSLFQERREGGYRTTGKFTWVIHCGGSQGFEAALILQHLYRYNWDDMSVCCLLFLDEIYSLGHSQPG